MSFDPNAGAPNPPMGNVEQPKSGKKWWMFGGIGCLVLGLVCCGGFGILGYFMYTPFQEMQAIMLESQEIARTSQLVEDAVGRPVAVADQPSQLMPQQYMEDGVPTQEIRFAVSGSKAKGDLVVKIAQPGGGLTFERSGLYLELEDGTEINLDGEPELDLDIDIGEGGDEAAENEEGSGE